MRESEHISLLVSAGDGPAECRQAVGHILQRMQDEAEIQGVSLSISQVEAKHGPKSAVVVAHGAACASFARAWTGTILWRMQSQLRREYKRSNWFVGVFPLSTAPVGGAVLEAGSVAFSTLRAGGPGGQHQNTTDSAVRAVHKPTGLVVVVRDGRSQHRNKALAFERLQALLQAQAGADEAQEKTRLNALHHALERGNPIRRFKGAGFREVT